MELINNMLDTATAPVLIAFLLGLITAISPCPLATNIAAIGFIGNDIEDRKKVFIKGVLYTVGRIFAYTLLGIVLISIMREGASVFGIQKQISKWGELLVGPLLIVMGLFMLFADRLILPKFGFSGNGKGLVKKGGWGAFVIGILFAMAFCPSSGIFYFGMLIPMSVTTTAGWLLPIIYAIATALPVLVVAWILAFSVKQIGTFYGRMQKVQKWANYIVGALFLTIGLYYCWMIYL